MAPWIRVYFVLFSIAACLTGLMAAQAANPELDEGLKLLEEGRTTLDDTALSRAQDYFSKLTQQHSESAAYLYELGRVESYRSSAWSLHGDKKKAERALDEAMVSVQQSLKLNEKSAAAHSLLADLYGRKIGLWRGHVRWAEIRP